MVPLGEKVIPMKWRKDNEGKVPDISTKTRLISFFGLEEGVEIYLYLASVLSKLGKRVLVLDNTRSQLFSECIPYLPGSESIVEYKYVSYTIKQQYDKNLFYLYDVVINISGYEYDATMEKMSDIVYVVADFQKTHLHMVQEAILALAGNFNIIYRDFTGGCVDAGYVEAVLHGRMGGKVAERIMLSLTKEDYLDSLQMQYNNTFQFEKLSPHYRELIIHIVQRACQEYAWKVPPMFRRNYRFSGIKNK
jgi:hypothetical protein